MLSYETIEKEALWVAKMTGWRTTGTYDELKSCRESGELRDFDIVIWEHQPEHLQKFFKDYQEQPYDSDRVFFLWDFYKEWIKKNKIKLSKFRGKV